MYKNKFALYLPVGPSAEEIPRTIDVVDSAAVYEDTLGWVIVIADGSDSHLQELHAALSNNLPKSVHVYIASNPRNGVGDGHTGGLCVATLKGFQIAQELTDAQFVLKVDTDSLVVGSFSERIVSLLKSRAPQIGIMGVIGDSFGENRTFYHMDTSRIMFEQLLEMPRTCTTLPDQGLKLRRLGTVNKGNFQLFEEMRTIAERAIANGGSLGEYCQGGGYVVSRLFLDRMAVNGFWNHGCLWRETAIGEDVVMGLYCAAIGLKMYDYTGNNAPFAIHPDCIPLSRQQIIACGASLIHSIKGSLEDEVRHFFAQRRRGVLTTSLPVRSYSK